MSELTARRIRLHGHEVGYKIGGSGPVVVAIAGITGACPGWDAALARLTESYTVISPDLFGYENGLRRHDDDYSLRANTLALRHLLVALGHDRATFMGHSLGGGVCLDFAYQHPEYVERLVLVSSGGLGRDVHPAVRFASLPGMSAFASLLDVSQVRHLVRNGSRILGRIGIKASSDLREIAHGFELAMNRESRQAFLGAVRGVVDHRGQRISAATVLYLLERIPMLIVWGERDSIIPEAHAREAPRWIRNGRVEIIPGAGHFPYIDRPDQLMALIADFISTTDGARLTPEDLAAALANGPSGRPLV